MTAAYYRTLAQDLESRLEWGRAAQAWQQAIDAYPPASELGKRDLGLMAQRRDQCEYAASNQQETTQ